MTFLQATDPAVLDWSRAQFALTACYHWLFVPLTLGLALVMAIMETIYYRTGNEFWKTTTQFWQKLFGINFAIGVATGIILEFQFGTNWSNYSWFVGDIFGAPLAIEGILAFFMESTFIALMFFGWGKISKGFHLASTWLTGLGATISAWWILVANSWMQHPTGMDFNPETVRNEMMDFFGVAFQSFAVNKFCHTVSSAWLTGSVFVVAVSCWYLLRGRNTKLATQSIKIAAIVGLVSGLIVAATCGGAVRRHGARASLLGIVLGGVIGSCLLMLLRGSSTWLVLIPGLVLAGAATGATGTIVNQLAVSSADEDTAGMTSGFSASARQLGIVMGVAVMGVSYERVIRSVMTMAPQIGVLGRTADRERLISLVASGKGLRALDGWPTAMTADMRSHLAPLVRSATDAGLSVSLGVGAAVMLAVAIHLALTVPGRRQKGEVSHLFAS